MPCQQVSFISRSIRAMTIPLWSLPIAVAATLVTVLVHLVNLERRARTAAVI